MCVPLFKQLKVTREDVDNSCVKIFTSGASMFTRILSDTHTRTHHKLKNVSIQPWLGFQRVPKEHHPSYSGPSILFSSAPTTDFSKSAFQLPHSCPGGQGRQRSNFPASQFSHQTQGTSRPREKTDEITNPICVIEHQ